MSNVNDNAARVPVAAGSGPSGDVSIVPESTGPDIFNEQWGGYAYYWAQHDKQCANLHRMMQGTSPLDFLEEDVRTDWHRQSYRLGCELAA